MELQRGLDLAAGSVVSVDISFSRNGARHVAKNISAALAGIDHGQFVLLRIPEKTMASLGQHLQRGASATVKYLRENYSFTFTSPVVGLSSEMAPMLWLGYPLEVAAYPIRKEPRVACNPYALVKVGAQRYEGAVADISSSGCRILVSPSVENDPSQLAAEVVVELRFQLPGQPDPITAYAEVRWFKPDTTPWGLGLSFTMMDEDSQQKIQRFLGAAMFYS